MQFEAQTVGWHVVSDCFTIYLNGGDSFLAHSVYEH
jgi:hypothetical protein